MSRISEAVGKWKVVYWLSLLRVGYKDRIVGIPGLFPQAPVQYYNGYL